MNTNSKKILLNLYDEFKNEKLDLESKFNENNLKIKNIDKTIDELMQYDDDGQMFSPRDISGVNSTKVDELKLEREVLVDDNNFIISRLGYFRHKVDDIHNALMEAGISENTKDENIDLSDDEGIRDNKANIMISKNKIKDIVYRLKLAEKLITTEPKKSSSELYLIINEFSKYI